MSSENQRRTQALAETPAIVAALLGEQLHRGLRSCFLGFSRLTLFGSDVLPGMKIKHFRRLENEFLGEGPACSYSICRARNGRRRPRPLGTEQRAG